MRRIFLAMAFSFCLCAGAHGAEATAPVASWQGCALGAITLPLMEGYEARDVEGETRYAPKGNPPLFGIYLAPLGSLGGREFAEKPALERSGDAVTSFGDDVFTFTGMSKSEPVSVFALARGESALVIVFYDDGPAGADILKHARASTRDLQDMLDAVVLSPEEREAKARGDGQ